jgi:hypothetical protein
LLMKLIEIVEIAQERKLGKIWSLIMP